MLSLDSPLLYFTAVLTQMACCVTTNCEYFYKTMHCISNHILGYFQVNILFAFVLNYNCDLGTLFHQVAFKLHIPNKIIAKLFIESRYLNLKNNSFLWSIAHKGKVNKSVKFAYNCYRCIEWILFSFSLAHVGIFLKIGVCHFKCTFFLISLHLVYYLLGSEWLWTFEELNVNRFFCKSLTYKMCFGA